MKMKKIKSFIAVLTAVTLCGCINIKTEKSTMNKGDQIKIGWAKNDITPQGPAFLAGQLFHRLALEVHDPLLTSAMAVESGNEKFIMISLDNTVFRSHLMERVREKVSAATGVPQLNIIGSATHTHTAPRYGDIVPREYWHKSYKSPLNIGSGINGIDIEEVRKKYPDLVDSKDYFFFLVDKISDCAIRSWQNRQPGKIAYGMGEAAVGECRRIVLNGEGGVMYADEALENVSHAEGHVDHSLNIMATYLPNGKLTGLIINIACPAQVNEAQSFISSDYWHCVREAVAKTYGTDVVILPQCSAAGDQSPHKILNRKADARMMQLRSQLKEPVADWTWSSRAFNKLYNNARCQEISRRIMTSLTEVLKVIKPTADAAPVVKHTVRDLALQPRLITESEYAEALANVKKIESEMAKNNSKEYNVALNRNKGVVNRYNTQAKEVFRELHVIRMGGAAFATNTFELYLDYGDRIKGASKAEQTFLVQLASAESGTYLPSRRSGTTGYGNTPQSCIVTPEAGDTIVKESVKEINRMFE